MCLPCLFCYRSSSSIVPTPQKELEALNARVEQIVKQMEEMGITQLKMPATPGNSLNDKKVDVIDVQGLSSVRLSRDFSPFSRPATPPG